MKHVFTTALVAVMLVLYTNPLFAFYNLKVGDPRGWNQGPGKIEEATIVVEPKGLYSEVSYYLTFSSAATSMTSSSDTLEVVYNFDLPQDALVTDSWLWVDNEIVKADIIDRWTATAIYENIVKRRKDPSLLTKDGNTYELRIFPLVGNSTRKVKLTFLLLNKWSYNNTFNLQLPLEMLNASKNQYCYYYYNSCGSGIPPSTKVVLKPAANSTINTVTTAAGQAISLSSFTGENGSKDQGFLISSTDYNNGLTINYNIMNIKNGVFLNTFSTGPEEGYYQLMFMPGRALDVSVKKKILFLIDYDVAKSTITATQLFASVKRLIENNFTAADSFAIMLSGFTITGSGEDWIKGDSISKAAVFQNVNSSYIKSYSNLTSLLAKGAEFVKQKNGGDIIIVAASEHNFSPTNSNQIINDYVASLPKNTRFSAVDITTNYTYNFFNIGVYYYGDGYFYSTLSRFTKGYFTSINEYNYNQRNVTSYDEMLSKAISSNSGLLTNFEIHTSLLNGFCSGRQNFTTSTETNNINTPFIQVGKYNGTFPFIIQASGLYNGKTFVKNFSAEEASAVQKDSATRTIWEGKYILSRELVYQSNPVIADIIDHSLKNRVLSKYTAFLALEKAQGGQICTTCNDESKVTSLNEELLTKDSVIVGIYPTPATKAANITIKDYLASGSSKLLIYNSLGEVVTQLVLPTFSRGKTEMEFNIEEANLPSGAYIMMYVNGDRSKKAKMIIQR